MAFGQLGATFGRLGASNKHGSGGATPTAPVLSLISVTGSSASLAVDVDDTVGAGDTVTLQTAASGTSFASPTTTNHTISSGEDSANEVDLSLSLATGTYDARASVTHGGKTSGWSNTVTFTITATASTFYILGF